MKKIILVLYLLLLCPSLAWGAGNCGAWGSTEGGTTPWTVSSDAEGTASAAYADVAACVGVATYGDTVNLGACAAGNCIWDDQIIITKNMSIVGAGTDATYLTARFEGLAEDYSGARGFFTFTPNADARARLDSLDEDTEVFEVTGIHFYKDAPRLGSKYGVWIVNSYLPIIKRVKIHHNSFTNIHRATYTTGYVHGVFYSNILHNTNGAYPQGKGNFTDDIRVPGTATAWFVEGNAFTWPADGAGDMSGAANAGGSHVVRYNDCTEGRLGFYVETHSNQPKQVGGYFTEIYNNFMTSSTLQNGIDMRGSQCFIFNNIANTSIYKVRDEFYDISSVPGATSQLHASICSGSTVAAATCEGTCPQVCADDCLCWKVNNSYFWNNRRTLGGAIKSVVVLQDSWDNSATGAFNKNPFEVVENREFWNQNESFDGTTGVGVGLAAAKPETCTAGVGYWATDERKLYRCKAGDDDWEVYYEPYTCPHPLTGYTGTCGDGYGVSSYNIESEAPKYTITFSTTGDGCSWASESIEVTDEEVQAVGTLSIPPNYTLVGSVGGTCQGSYSGVTGRYTTSALDTTDCTVTAVCKKLSPDTAIGSGAAVKFGVGAGAIVR